jgi:uncharacterized protein
VWRLILAGALGIPVGLLLLTVLPAAFATRLLGLVLVGYSLFTWFGIHRVTLHHPHWAYVFGFAAGVLGSAYNTSGPPMVVYASWRAEAPEQFQATLQSFFLPTSVLIILGHAVSGLWTIEVLLLFVLSLPVNFVAFWLGQRLQQHIPQAQFARLVRIGILLIGLRLLF